MTFHRLIFPAGNLMFGANFIKGLAERLARAGLHFIQPALDAANRVERVFKRGGVLHNQLRPAVDRQHDRTPAALEPAQMRLGVALKIRQRPDILQGNHDIEFNVLSMLR